MSVSIMAGAALSLSGRFAVQGEQAWRGLTLWAEHVNAQGGLRVGAGRARRPVELHVYDDGSKIAGAKSATERLIAQDRVALLFSPYSSVLALAAAEVAHQHGRVLWNHGGSSDALDERGWRHVVTLLSPASRYFVPVLELARANVPPARSVALLYGVSGTFPRAVIGGARAHATSLGLKLVLEAPYPDLPPLVPRGPHSDAERGEDVPPPLPRTGEGAERKEIFSSLVARIAALRPDVILGVGTTEADLAFARELRRQGIRARIVGLVAAPIERFRDELGADVDGFCGPSQWEPSLRGQPDLGPTSDSFSADVRARFGVEPDYPAAQAYAAGLIAGRCVEIAGSFEDTALRQAAAALDLTTFYGRFHLDPRSGQQIGHQMVVAQWQAGQKQIVWPPDLATAGALTP